MSKIYIGDGVSAEYDGGVIVLTTVCSKGIAQTNTIHIYPSPWAELKAFINLEDGTDDDA